MFVVLSGFRLRAQACALAALLSLNFFSLKVIANQDLLTQNLQDKVLVSEIDIRGLSRTKKYVVLRELIFKTGDQLSTDILLESIQRVKNTELFSEVSPFIERLPNNTAKIIIRVKEKWTAIPYMNYSSGGGTEQLTAGFYDINIAGRFIQSGVQYDNWNGEHSGSIWLQNPRMFNKRVATSVSYFSIKKPKSLYLDSGVKTGSYVLARNLFKLSLEKKYESGFSSGTAIELYEDAFIAYDSNEMLDKQTLLQISDSNKSRAKLYSFSAKYGRTDYDNFLFSGGESGLTFKHSMLTKNTEESFYHFVFLNRYYKRLPHSGNLALQARLGVTNTQQLQHQFLVGGFQHVRGYFDGQFRGGAYWQLNAEYRIPSYRHKLAIFQHNFFVDVTEVKNDYTELTFDKDSIKLSAGLGIRIIIPWIYRSVGRLDYAVFRGSSQSSRIALGVKQFF